MFLANPKNATEELLANASESLDSASVMLGELAVNQALDNVAPTE
jgi:hypothetical protein